ncbi:MAG TPA: protein kinase [Bryobacteraceae bacterium]|nr:protein kinase [Bryobacteraceae bacterium]
MPNKVQDDDLVMNLVDLALSRPAEERTAYLETACAGDTELLTKVSHYVEWEERMNGFLLDPLYAPVDNEHPFEPGQLLCDRFRIVREVAQGGMGIVYEATDEKLERRIALKCSKTGFRKRLPPEVRNATAISHPNVCKIFEIHTALTSQGETDFITMEFLDGETLAERLRRGSLPSAEARAIALQLCAGLAEAHRNHVIHGDLKCNNVILTAGPEGSTRAVITDFGLARQPEADQRMAQSGERCGTPDYMAPELWKGEAASPASDVYALGVMLYELLAGRRPYPAETSWEQRLTAKPAGVDSKWDRVLARCLDPDPLARFQDAQQVAQALAPKRSWRWFVAAAALLAIITWAVTYQGTSGPKDSWRLAMLPAVSPPALAPVSTQLSQETDQQLSRLSGGKVARLTIIPLKKMFSRHAGTVESARSIFAATHVLRLTLEPEGNNVLLHATLADTRGGPNKDWKAEYTPRQMRYAPVALAGFVTGTLHLPPLGSNVLVNAAAKQDYLAGIKFVRRDSGVDSALESLERAVAADPDSPLTYAGLAEAQWFKYYLIRDQVWLERATDSARQAELRNPDLPAVHRIDGILLENSGLYELAEAEFRRAIELAPGDSDGYRRLGQVFERNNRIDDALAAYRKAIEVDPAYYRNYQALGAFYFQHGKFREAAKEFESTVALAPDESSAHYALATAYVTTGRFPEAERELRSSLALKETSNALSGLSVVLLYEHRPQEAIPYLLRALAHFPEQCLWWTNLGIAYQLANRDADAQRAFRRGLELSEKEITENPRDGLVRSRLAYLCAKLRDSNRAESEIAQALQVSPDDAPTRDMAVKTYDALGERSKALAILVGSPDQVLADVRLDADLAGLQNDPQFQQLLASRQIK